jgi:hypothetical protein
MRQLRLPKLLQMLMIQDHLLANHQIGLLDCVVAEIALLVVVDPMPDCPLPNQQQKDVRLQLWYCGFQALPCHEWRGCNRRQ